MTSFVEAFLVPDKIWCMNHSIHYSITDHCSVLLVDTKWQGLARFHLSVSPVLRYEILQVDGTWYDMKHINSTFNLLIVTNLFKMANVHVCFTEHTYNHVLILVLILMQMVWLTAVKLQILYQ